MKHKTALQAFKLMQRAKRMLRREFNMVYYGEPVESWLVYESGQIQRLIEKINNSK